MNTIYHFENVSALEQTEIELQAPPVGDISTDRELVGCKEPVGEEKILQEPQEIRLVLGIDYGTTFSGEQCFRN
jgi:hypothetical protein